jgi:hypothetical protein
MKLIVKLLVVAVVLHATMRAGLAEYRFYVFEDAVQQEALFSQRLSPQQLVSRVVELAEDHDIPVEPDAVAVDYNGPQATVSVNYSERVELVPRVYSRDWPFELRVSVRRMP